MDRRLIKEIYQKYLQKDISIALLFGVLSVIFRFINFNIPGFDGIQSDLRELPLIIGIIHLSNPFYSIILSAISSISFSVNSTVDLYTFGGHVIPLFILWYLFKALGKYKFNIIKNAIASLLLVLSYYLMSVLLAIILPNKLNSLNQDNMVTMYIKLFDGASFEMMYTAIAISFYYVQYKVRVELQKHKLNLETIVYERTEHLHSVINELKITQNHLVQSEKMASIGTLTSGVAHELNNPLNFISGGLNIIKDIKPEIEKSISDELNKSYTLATHIIDEGFNRSVDIVNALMTFSRKGES